MKTDKADKWFSLFIRLRDSDDKGYCKCVTCNTTLYFSNMDCGHWIKRQHSATRFNEKNCHAQCRQCNWLKQGNDFEYTKFIISEYGQQTHDLLKSSERQPVKHLSLEINLIAKEYQKKAKDLAKEKGIIL